MHWPSVWHWGQWSRAKQTRTLQVLQVSEAPAAAVQGEPVMRSTTPWDGFNPPSSATLSGYVPSSHNESLFCGLVNETQAFTASWDHGDHLGRKKFLISEDRYETQGGRVTYSKLISQQQISESEPSNLSPRQVLSLLHLLSLSHPCYIKGHCSDEVLALTVTLVS